MRRPLILLASGLFAVSLLLSGSLSTFEPASAATIASTTRCSNGVDDTPGLGLICQVTIVNTITTHGGSAAVTVRECHGAAGAPTAKCTITRSRLSRPVRIVNQCNNSTNGGGGTLRCSVRVTNNFIATNPGATGVTVNQCVGSGDGIANACDPFPANTSGATITQCNGSANGGTLVQLKCTATGTKSAKLAVTINQCNNSTNGGGALVICSARIVNNRVSADTTTANLTQPPTDTQPVSAIEPASDQASWTLILLLLVGGSAFLVATTVRRRRG